LIRPSAENRLEVTMRTLFVLVSLVLATPALAKDAPETHVFNDSGGTHTFECTAQKPEVALNGSSATITITGACTKIAVNGSSLTVTIADIEKLAINGSSNTVDVDAAAKIAVTGTNNKVTWKRGKGKAAKPKIGNLGTGNTITKAK
jgi:hypothetical protein